MPLINFLSEVTGIIHVGAATGEWRSIYAKYNLDVIWFEPIPSVFEKLKSNLIDFPKQAAYKYLVMDEDDKMYPFHIADNGGASSSTLELYKHKEAWPNVHYTGEILQVQSITLDTFFNREKLDKRKFQALALDTQGTELHVLKGALQLLPHIKIAEIEGTDFEAYKGGATISEIDTFMMEHGFEKIGQEGQCFSEPESGLGMCYNVLYKSN